jgi:hyperosmotically inducible protein
MNSIRHKLALAVALGVTAAGFGLSTAAFAADNAADVKSEQPVTDTWITTKVKSELATTQGVSSTDISVKTSNGIVTLIGTQETKTAVDKAVAVARAVKGVKDVDASALKSRG